MARRFVRITQESAFGTYTAVGGGPSANPAIVIRGNGSNYFKPLTKPELWQIMDTSGMNIVALTGSNVTVVGGQLVTQFYASQAQFLLGWALQRINTAQTSPWTTTELPYDLASCTIDFGYTRGTTAIKRTRYTGMKVVSGSIECSTESPVATLTLTLIGSTPQGNTFDSSTDPDATVFPEPALTAYPTDPYVFQHSLNGLTIGTVRTKYDKLNISWTNQCKAYYDENRFANAVKMNGRKISWSTNLRLRVSPDDRASTYELVNASTGQVVFANGTNTCTLNFNGKNYMETLEEDLPLDGEFYYGLNLFSALDSAVAAPNSDLQLSFT